MNLKILYTKPSKEQKSKTVYSVNMDNSTIKISFSTDYRGTNVNKEAVISVPEYKGRVARVTLQTIWKPAEVYIAPMYELSSKYREFQEVKNNAFPIARVFIPKEENCVLVLLEQPTDFNNTQFESMAYDSSVHTKSGIMIDSSDEFHQIIKRHIRKRDTICKLDIYDTVTYLESQVDALTLLVIDLLNGRQFTKNELSNAVKVLQTSNVYNVLNIKPIDKILTEISTDKKDVREMQGGLFAKQ